MPASGDPAQGERGASDRVAHQPVRDDGPHDLDAGDDLAAGGCPAQPARRSFLRGALGAGVGGAVAGAAAGAAAGYAYRSSRAAPPGQVFDASLVEGRLRRSRSTGVTRRASWPSRTGRRSCSRSP